jgi:hypothetical protein
MDIELTAQEREKYRGKFLLIHDGEVADSFFCYNDALKAGYVKHGVEEGAFIVQYCPMGTGQFPIPALPT